MSRRARTQSPGFPKAFRPSTALCPLPGRRAVGEMAFPLQIRTLAAAWRNPSGPATTARSAAPQPSVVSLRQGGETCLAAAPLLPAQHYRRSASSRRWLYAYHPPWDGCRSSSECMIVGSSDKLYWTSRIGCWTTSASRASKPSVRPAGRSGNDIALEEATSAGGLFQPSPFPIEGKQRGGIP